MFALLELQKQPAQGYVNIAHGGVYLGYDKHLERQGHKLRGWLCKFCEHGKLRMTTRSIYWGCKRGRRFINLRSSSRICSLYAPRLAHKEVIRSTIQQTLLREVEK